LQAVGQRISGKLLEHDNKYGLVVYDLKPDQGAKNLLILRYAFVTRSRGGGDHIFPASILDDWGRELRSLRLYRWMRENGERFPRAEIFGYEKDGRETQCFVRELELYATFPCYAFLNPEQPVSDGRLISAIFLPDASAKEVRKIAKPSDVRRPLRSARVTWWEVPENYTAIEFSQLNTQADPGY
jgi:hypothetical protein